MVFCISTSGNSNNIIRAAKVAKDKQIKVIALTGERVSELSKLADVWFAVPSTDTPRVQECHILIGHIICELIESEMFPNENK